MRRKLRPQGRRSHSLSRGSARGSFRPALENLETRTVLDYSVSALGASLNIAAEAGDLNNLTLSFDSTSHRYILTEQNQGIVFNIQAGVPAEILGNGTNRLEIPEDFFDGSNAALVGLDNGDDILHLQVATPNFGFAMGSGSDTVYGTDNVDTITPPADDMSPLIINQVRVSQMEMVDLLGGIETLNGTSGFDLVRIEGANLVTFGSAKYRGIDVVDLLDNPSDSPDRIEGLVGDDVVQAISGTEAVTSGITFRNFEIFDGRSGVNSLLGTAGGDFIGINDTRRVQFGNSGFFYLNLDSLNAGGGTDLVVGKQGNSGSDTVTLTGANAFTSSGIAFTSIEQFDGRDGTSPPSDDNDIVLGLAGDDVVLLLSAPESFRTSNISFINVEAFDGQGGTDTVAGQLNQADAVSLTGTGAFTVQEIAFTNTEQFDGQTGVDVITLDQADAGVTIDFDSAFDKVATMLGVLFNNIESIDTNGKTLTLTEDGNPVDVVSLGLLNNQIALNQITMTEVTALDGVDTLVGPAPLNTVPGSAGNDEITIVGVNALRTRAIDFTGIKGYRDRGGTDTVIFPNTPTTPLVFTFDPAQTINNRLISQDYGITFDQVDVVDPNGRNVELVHPETVFLTTVDNQAAVQGILYKNVIRIVDADAIVGSAGDDLLLVTANKTGLTHNINLDGFNLFDGADDTRDDNIAADDRGDRITFDVAGVTTYDLTVTTSTNGRITIEGIDFGNIEHVVPTSATVTLTGVDEGTPARSTIRNVEAVSSGVAKVNQIRYSNVTSITRTETVQGTTGDDTIQLNPDDTFSMQGVNYSRVRVLTGGSGIDNVIGPVGASGWNLTLVGIAAPNGQTISVPGFLTPNSSSPNTPVDQRLAVFGFESLTSGAADDTIFGTEGNDAFLFLGPDTLGFSRLVNFSKIDGRGGDDTFSFHDADAVINDASFSGDIDGGDGTDTILGDDDGNRFIIRGRTDNTLETKVGGTFSNFENITGGAGDDRFEFRQNDLTRITIDGLANVTVASDTNRTAAGDVLDFSGISAGGLVVSYSSQIILVGLVDFITFRNTESIIGTNFADRFQRSTTTGGTQFMDGRGGADLFQTANTVVDVVKFDAQDLVGATDTTDIYFSDVPGQTPGTEIVYAPTSPAPATTNLWQSLQSGQTGGFITTTNFPLVAEAFLRYLSRYLLGVDPDAPSFASTFQYLRNQLLTESMSSLDFIRTITRYTDTNPNDAVFTGFFNRFFTSFAARGYGTPFAGKDINALVQLARNGMPLETIALGVGVRLNTNILIQSWVNELLINPTSTAIVDALREEGSGAAIAGYPPITSLRTVRDLGIRLLLREGRDWLTTIEFMVNTPDVLRAAIREEAVRDPFRFGPLITDSSQTSLKLGSFEAGVWFLDAPPGDLRALGQGPITFGAATDIPVIGDWNGNGDDNLGVYRGGTWFLDTNGQAGLQSNDARVLFGQYGDVPTPGDWDGDGDDQIGIFRQGLWYLDSNGTPGYQPTDIGFAFGRAGDVPLVGDWNGDGIDDPGIYRSGMFYLDTNGVRGWQGIANRDTSFADSFGFVPGVSRIVVADFNADGRDDIAVVTGNMWKIDMMGPFGFQPSAGDVEIFYDVNGGIPIAAQTGVFVFGRLIAGQNYELQQAALMNGLSLLSTSSFAPSGSSSTNSSSSGGTNSQTSFKSVATGGATDTPSQSEPTRSTGTGGRVLASGSVDAYFETGEVNVADAEEAHDHRDGEQGEVDLAFADWA